jgi:hypothetical protein
MAFVYNLYGVLALALSMGGLPDCPASSVADLSLDLEIFEFPQRTCGGRRSN